MSRARILETCRVLLDRKQLELRRVNREILQLMNEHERLQREIRELRDDQQQATDELTDTEG
jgi:hypothetical protein